MTIDSLCTRYHKLPSEILAEATTFDLMVANTGVQYEQHQREEAEAEAEAQRTGRPKAPKARKLTQDQMLDMLKRARE